MIPSFMFDPIATDWMHEKLLEKFGTKPFTTKEFEGFRADLARKNHGYCRSLQTLRKWNVVIIDHQETFIHHDKEGTSYLLDDGTKIPELNNWYPLELGEYTKDGKKIVDIIQGADFERSRNYYAVNLGYTQRRYTALKKACEKIQEKIVTKSAEIENLKREIAALQALYKDL